MEEIEKRDKREKEMMNFKEFKELSEKEKLLKKTTEILRVEDKDLPRVIDRFQREIKEMESDLKEFRK